MVELQHGWPISPPAGVEGVREREREVFSFGGWACTQSGKRHQSAQTISQ